MFYLVIGIVVVVAVGALFTQRSRRSSQAPSSEPQKTGQPGEETLQKADGGAPADSLVLSRVPTEAVPEETKAVPPPAEPSSEEIVPLQPLLAAVPISSPNALSSATYSSSAPTVLSGDSPYAHGNTLEEMKPKLEPSLLRWSGKTGNIQVGDLTVRGPVAYWSSGPSSTPEPSCIDVTLPVTYPGSGQELPHEGSLSYQDMHPLLRGIYLLWLAEGRIQPPPYAYIPALWLFGLERRVLVDKLDVSLCIGEAFRLLPLVRWEPLQQALIRFVAWMAAKIWMPEEQLLSFCQVLPTVPVEILDMLLRPYADARLGLPSVIAFTVLRASTLAGSPMTVPHSEELLTHFSTRYKSACPGGMVLTKPKSSLFLAYVPTNPSLAGDKGSVGGVLELPDFFKDPTDFAPLIAVWRDFLKTILPPPPLSLEEEVADRPDWEAFVTRLTGGAEPADEGSALPLVTELGALAALMRVERKEENGEDKPAPRGPGAADRKKISDAARVEGFLVLPNLGISGKEYHWDDPVILAPLEMGAKLSQDYNAASLLLEFCSSLMGAEGASNLDELQTRLDAYFSLSSDDRARLSALSIVLLTRPRDPEDIGGCLQFWLQRKERAVVRDFVVDFLTPSLLGEETRSAFTERLCALLDVNRNDPLPTEKKLLELGEQTGKVLAPLFKD